LLLLIRKEREQIIKIINLQLPALRDQYKVKRLGLFGSAARGEVKAESDIDILVEFESPVGFFYFIRLENLLSKALGKKVDLVSGKAIKPALKDAVFREIIYV
jgi:predicted nucleotidyltransferase